MTCLIRTAKAQYYKRKLEEVKHDSKKLWQQLLNIIRKNKPNEDLPRHFVVDGTYINQPDIVSDKFNSFFCNIATDLEAAIPPSATDPLSYLPQKTPSHPFCFYPTNHSTVGDIVRNLNNCGAGSDGISTKILKMLCPDIIPHLTHLFNLCLSQGIFPSSLKRAVIVPIFKSGDRFAFNNYRPIAILPTISKILEKIVFYQLSSYLIEEELLLPSQFGFRKHHSTYMPISLLYDYVTNKIKNKEFCAALYLDLSKAFDTVNPNILLKKLHHYGIRDKCLDFFHSYLVGRSQVLKYNSYISTSAKTITLGVPQGSILGPLLFLLYINDMHKSSAIPQFLLYADDTALLYSAPTLTELQSAINASLPDIATWLNSNRLTLNVKKSTYQLFSIKYPLPDITIRINGFALSRSKFFKYLGVTIDENLKWDSHIKQVETTISRNIGLIGRSQRFLNSSCLILLYNALILPFFNYCLQIWGSTYPSKLSCLVTLQKKNC